MSSELIPSNENERLKALHSYSILDTLSEETFDRITQLAAIICDVPIALVSLIDSDRQWFKSKVGLEVNETAREISFCQYAILDQHIFEVENAKADIRFKDNPLVKGEPKIQFYAGYPLEDPNGYNLGTLCVIDQKPKKLNEQQQLALRVLGKEVVDHIVARKNVLELQHYKQLFDISDDIMCIVDYDGNFKHVNQALENIIGIPKTELINRTIYDFLHPDDIEHTKKELNQSITGNQSIHFKNRCLQKNGNYINLQWGINPENSSHSIYAIARDNTKENEIELINRQKLQRSETQKEILSKISTIQIDLNNSVDKVLEALLTFVHEGLNVKHVGLWMLENDKLINRKMFIPETQEFNSGEILHQANFPNYYNRLISGKSIVASNALTNEFTREFKDIYLEPNGINSMLDVPVWKDGVIIGVLCNESEIKDRNWSDEDISFARNMADIIALKISEYERKQKEAEALLMSSRLKNLLINFQEAVLVEDEYRKIVLTNPKFCELFGIPVPPEAIVGMDCSTSAEENKHLFKNSTSFVERIDLILKNKKIVIGEELRMVNGKILERDYVPIFIEESYFGHLWKYRDVTLSRLLATELETARNELKVTFDTITEGVVLQTNTGEIVNFNPAACKILKMTESQIRGKTSLDPDWNAVKEDGSPFPGEEHPAMVALKTKKSVFNVIMGVRFRKETPTWININAVLLPDNQGVVCSFSDITERKQMEDDKIKFIELEASNKLAEQTLKAREEFLANMSHEIRTPMNSIIGLSNLMDKAGELNKKQRSYLDVIQLNSENLLNIINDILDYSKLESGKFEIEKIDFHLPETLKNITASMQVLADKYEIKIELNIDQKLPLYVKGDALRISQILTNLVSNAIKFSNHKDISVEIEYVKETQNKITYRTKVIDSGIGVSPEKIAEIIKPFTQESSSTTRQYGGTGLGLSIVSKLLEYMGSKLEIESKPGKGSTFSFLLTQEKGSQVGIQEKSTLTKLIGKYYILLVEDNQFNQLVAIDTLKDWNPSLEIFIANNGQEAIELLEKQCVDIILMDIQMPIMDGYTATKMIRSSEKHWQNVPIVAMTAHASSMEVEKCMNIGMNGYLSKPFHQSDLFEKITQFIYSQEREEIADKNSLKEIDSEKIIQYTPPITSHIVDTEFILNFTKGKIERIEKMVQMFIEETPEELKNLEEYYESKQYSNLRTLAHSFKPKFTYMGMPHLSEIAKQIEHNANALENLVETKALIETLKEETQKAYRELSEFLASQK